MYRSRGRRRQGLGYTLAVFAAGYVADFTMHLHLEPGKLVEL